MTKELYIYLFCIWLAGQHLNTAAQHLNGAMHFNVDHSIQPLQIQETFDPRYFQLALENSPERQFGQLNPQHPKSSKGEFHFQEQLLSEYNNNRERNKYTTPIKATAAAFTTTRVDQSMPMQPPAENGYPFNQQPQWPSQQIRPSLQRMLERLDLDESKVISKIYNTIVGKDGRRCFKSQKDAIKEGSSEETDGLSGNKIGITREGGTKIQLCRNCLKCSKIKHRTNPDLEFQRIRTIASQPLLPAHHHTLCSRHNQHYVILVGHQPYSAKTMLKVV